MRHDLRWMAPAPRWRGAGADGEALRRPAILGFDGDDFIERLTAHLGPPPDEARRPRPAGDLGDFLLRWETGRLPPAWADPSWSPSRPEGAVPKLFQPAHGRFYLVAASLVCRTPGLPDHRVDLARGEQAGFVLRRFTDGVEHAWVASPDPERRGWEPLGAAPDRLLEGEEVVPMFPVNYAAGDGPRRLWAGLIPTASRETLRAGRPLPPGAPAADEDPRLAEPRAKVRQGLEALHALADLPLTPAEVAALRADADLQACFWLLDLAALLRQHLPAVWANVTAGAPALSGEAEALAALLRPLGAALDVAWAQRLAIAGEPAPAAPPVPVSRGDLAALGAQALDERILAALREAGAGGGPVVAELPRFDVEAEHRYVVRCVKVPHACARPHPAVVGARSDPFEIASYFDAEAPARPVRISLPVDVSVAALRKSPRSVAFVISKQLRAQMARIGTAKKLLDGKLEAPRSSPFDLGEICSLSIPILTLVAFVVLFIFLVLLNLIFWWLPFVKVCFPLPRPASEP